MSDQPEIETLMLANHVEAINNLLYISGGGWTDHWRPIINGTPVASQLGVGVTILVPWNATNLPCPIKVWFETGDGEPVGQQVQAMFNAGRPPGLRAGSEQRAAMAIQIPGLMFSEEGDYCVKATIGTSEARIVNFRVHTLQLPTGNPLLPFPQ